MTDERVRDYLRSRGDVEVPPSLVTSVMGAVDESLPSTFRVGAWIPAAAITAALAVVATVALLIGQGLNIGPGPSPATSPRMPSASEPTMDELRFALLEAVDVLQAAPGVEGRQQTEIAGKVGSATWFEWRPNGDHVVVQRHDLDVTETGWWMVPDGAPPSMGERIYTYIGANVGDQHYFTGETGDWQVLPRDDGYRTGAFGLMILDRATLPWQLIEDHVESLPDSAEARIERADLPDGGIEWRLEYPWLGTPLIQRWTIGPGGELRSWAMEREKRPVDPDGDFNANATLAWLQFSIADGDPIEPPDLDTEPDAAALGLPPDFALGP